LKKPAGSVWFGFSFISKKLKKPNQNPKKPEKTEPNPEKTKPKPRKQSQTGLNRFLS
jgi:hypothetical protein